MNRKQKWRNILISDENIDEYMEDLYNDTKGQYINQGVSFNKDDLFQMNILKETLLSHGSFSSLVKHLLHAHFSKDISNIEVKVTDTAENSTTEDTNIELKESVNTIVSKEPIKKKKDTFRGNSLSAFTTPED